MVFIGQLQTFPNLSNRFDFKSLPSKVINEYYI